MRSLQYCLLQSEKTYSVRPGGPIGDSLALVSPGPIQSRPRSSSYGTTGAASTITWRHRKLWNRTRNRDTQTATRTANGDAAMSMACAPLMVVSEYTQVGYVSGAFPSPGKTFPYIHDFGSILRFTELNFGLKNITYSRFLLRQRPMLPMAPTTTFRYRTSLTSTHHAASLPFQLRIHRANSEAITRLSKMEPIPLRPAPTALRARRTTSHDRPWVIQCWAAERDFSCRPPCFGLIKVVQMKPRELAHFLLFLLLTAPAGWGGTKYTVLHSFGTTADGPGVPSGPPNFGQRWECVREHL